MLKYSLKGISHVVKKDEKTCFLAQNEPKNADFCWIKIFPHVIRNKKFHIFENPYRDSPKGISYVPKKD